MTLPLLEAAASALGPLTGEVAFVGGASVTLWITDPAAPAPRPTKDVDVVVEVASRRELHRFEERMRERSFREDTESGVICRWRYGEDLIVDVIPVDAELIGFTNRWFKAAHGAAVDRTLPSGAGILAVSPEYLVATKLEAWADRGRGDHLASRDLEDIVTLVDGRAELEAEMAVAPDDVRGYVAREISTLLGERRFQDALFGFLRPDAASQARCETVVLPRLSAMAAAGDEPARSGRRAR